MITFAILLLLSFNEDLARIASAIDSTVGVSAMNLATGKRVSIRGGERFPMGSVYKFPIGIEVLSRVDAGKLRLGDEVKINPSDFAPGHSPIRDKARGKSVTMTIGALVESMVGESDNTACDVLLGMVTPEAVTKRMQSLGASGVRIDRSEARIMADIRARGAADYAGDPRDTATPDAMVALLTRVARGEEGLSADSHRRLLEIMTASRRNRIKVDLPSTVSVAHKSGQMPGTRNDVGIVTLPDGRTRIVIAVFTKSGERSSEDLRGETISRIARRVYDELTAPAESTTRRP